MLVAIRTRRASRYFASFTGSRHARAESLTLVLPLSCQAESPEAVPNRMQHLRIASAWLVVSEISGQSP
jgi:hypothetical protein